MSRMRGKSRHPSGRISYTPQPPSVRKTQPTAPVLQLQITSRVQSNEVRITGRFEQRHIRLGESHFRIDAADTALMQSAGVGVHLSGTLGARRQITQPARTTDTNPSSCSESSILPSQTTTSSSPHHRGAEQEERRRQRPWRRQRDRPCRAPPPAAHQRPSSRVRSLPTSPRDRDRRSTGQTPETTANSAATPCATWRGRRCAKHTGGGTPCDRRGAGLK